MARYRLQTDAYRDGVYYRSGEVMVCEGDQKPPKGSILLKDAPVGDPEVAEVQPGADTPSALAAQNAPPTSDGMVVKPSAPKGKRAADGSPS